MEYQDFCEKFDTKQFELLAKEYSKNLSQKVNIFNENNSKKEEFLVKFESLLEILFTLQKTNFAGKKTLFSKQNLIYKQHLKEVTKNLCKIYCSIKNKCYFSPFEKVFYKKENAADEVVLQIRNILESPLDFLQNEQRKSLIESLIYLLKMAFVKQF